MSDGDWHIKREITVGHLITTIAICAGLVGQWFLMQAKNEQQDRDIARVEALAQANASNLSDLSEAVGRMDERTAFMVEALNRIERRQERPQ
ncbi:MAG: hypothetical protein VX529_08150 [Pseudomonadota bacterium]|nr:hypothetical protein [Pseudomonadota bacterium]